MEKITISVTDESMVSIPGRVQGSRLVFRADGLEIYVQGVSRFHHEDTLRCLALAECDLRHIPKITLRDQRVHPSQGKILDTKTRPMF